MGLNPMFDIRQFENAFFEFAAQMEDEAIESLNDENAWAGSEILDEDKFYCTILLSYGVGKKMFTKLYKLDKETLKTFEP